MNFIFNKSVAEGRALMRWFGKIWQSRAGRWWKRNGAKKRCNLRAGWLRQEYRHTRNIITTTIIIIIIIM